MNTTIARSVAALAVLAWTTGAPAQITPAEHQCQAKASKVMVRFGTQVAKCGVKCQRNARRGRNPFDDCYPPYGGATAACMFDPIRGAGPRAVKGFRRACDPTVTERADCPECYSNGSCFDEAYNRVAQVQGQLDSVNPGLYCDRTPTPLAARCMDETVKALVRLGKTLHRCFDVCFARERTGTLAPGSCDPPPSDPATGTCVASSETKAVATIDRTCTHPRGEYPACWMSTDARSWVSLISIGMQGNVPSKYCGSPSVAFVDE